MENNKELLLVYRTMNSVSVSEPVNIMLTPQFYTLKKERLPVKYAYQAQRLAASLFEGLLDREGEYDYFLYKEGEYWVFIAYDIAKIIDFLDEKGFRQGDVSKIFFAQQAIEEFTAPYVLSDQDALMVLDETIVIVPISALDTPVESSLKFDRHFTPKKGVSLESVSSSIFTLKQAAFFSSVFILFALMFFIEGSRYGGQIQSTQEELEVLYEDYPSLQSAYTRDGIMSKYKQRDKTERAKRDAVKKISDIIFKGVTLTALTVDNKSVKANFSCKSKEINQRLKHLAQKAKFKVSKTKGSLELHLEGAL